MKYIGTKFPNKESKGNYGDIWEKQENGMYRCTQGQHKGLNLTEGLIQSDIKNGYLRPLSPVGEALIESYANMKRIPVPLIELKPIQDEQ